MRTSAFLLYLSLILGLLLTPATQAVPPPDLSLEVVTSGFNRPVAVRHAGDGSGRLFVVEQAGRIRIFDGTQVLGTDFLDIRSLVDDAGNEQGLLGLAFHPDYASNGFFYVNYTRDPGAALDRTVIARYQVSSGNANVANAGSALTLLEIEQDFTNHNGGDIHFGPDGYLYIGMGDGGSGGDPNNRAQDLNQLLGKMLRIDVDETSIAGPEGLPSDCGLVGNYAIPASNPFVGVTGCDEIWAYGVRNPWRWSFDRLTGDLLIGDVGQNAWEEIDFQPASSTGGENYGWNCFEGTSTFPGGSSCTASTVDPILEHSHGGGRCSITGGFRIRSLEIGALYADYVYADYCSDQMWFAQRDGSGNWTSAVWADNTANSVVAFGEDEAGEVYVVSQSGTIYRFDSFEEIFADGFESGDVSQWSSTAP